MSFRPFSTFYSLTLLHTKAVIRIFEKARESTKLTSASRQEFEKIAPMANGKVWDRMTFKKHSPFGKEPDFFIPCLAYYFARFPSAAKVSSVF